MFGRIILLTIVGVLQVEPLCAQEQLPARWGDQGDGTFLNPILRADYSDPDPLRVGDDYYLVASTFESYPGVTILHSRDLINWETIGYAFNNLDKVSDSYTWQKMNRYNGGVYAPTLTYHNGRYYIYANLYTDGFYMAWADNPKGPWHEQMLKDAKGRLLRIPRWSDPCPFWDEDGSAYLMTSHPRRTHWYSYLFQMSRDGTQLLDADSVALAANTDFYEWPKGGTCISPYHSSEGNRIFKRNGYYYLQHIEFTNLGQGEGTYIFRSKNIYGDGGEPGHPGEYEKYCVERVSDRNNMRFPGQGGYVTTPDGRWWWIGQFTRDNPEGRVPYLVPVRWENDWPVMDETPVRMEKPIQGFSPQLPQGSDDFSDQELRSIWQWNHSPRNDKWSLSERKGWLRLHAFRPQGKQKGFFGAGNTLLQHTMSSEQTVITTRMDIRHLTDDCQAGLAIFNGGKSYACIGVINGSIFYEENKMMRNDVVIPNKTKYIYLQAVINNKGRVEFHYSFSNSKFKALGVSYKMEAGNFRGAMVGLFCYNTASDTGYVDFDFFDYQIKNR